jgi:hypothetical protein
MTERAYKAALNAANLGPGTPAWTIVTRPGYELWNHEASNDALVSQLCRNFHDYGRTNGWQWIPEFNGNSGPLGQGGPLIDGTKNRTNCGGFNASVRLIASNILNLTGVFTNSGATTPENFITRIHTTVIDAAWTGNVRTIKTDFATLGAYKFSGHSWNKLVGGQHYDATTNTLGFANKKELFWCTLDQTRNRCYAVASRRAFIRGPAPHYCISADLLKEHRKQFPRKHVGERLAGVPNVTRSFIDGLPDRTGPGNWPAFLLVSSAHLPADFAADFVAKDL